ncbi:hypothetical protein V8C42DRAFT_122840 [Trichoderma barbatum]
MRTRSGMPVIEGDGLNGALPIHQGMTEIKHADETFHCTVYGQEFAPQSKARSVCRLIDRGNPLGSRRCGPCHTAFSKDGKEHTPGADGEFRGNGEMRKQHQAWVAEGNADVCGNTACAALRQPGANFSGWMRMQDAVTAKHICHITSKVKGRVLARRSDNHQRKSFLHESMCGPPRKTRF